MASDFQFRKDAAGGGVLFDTGAHTLDMLIWWFGFPEVLSYWDDDYGGVEADCLMEFRLPNGSQATIELSRTRALRNSAVIEGSAGRLEVDFASNTVRIDNFDSRGAVPLELGVKPGALGDSGLYGFLFDRQLDDWFKHLTTGEPTISMGSDARRVVDLMGICYARRQNLELPWMAF